VTLTAGAGPAKGPEVSTTRHSRIPRPIRGFGRRLPSWPATVLALIAYVPLLLTAPGYVGADTKQYLYIDPDRLLARAPYLWDKYVGMGGVTHQNIGYLLPQGPWYWVFDKLGVPDWVAQRLWTGTLLFIAATGVLALLRTFGWKNRPAFLASAAYVLSPYVLEYVARISAILLPWAWLPWMVVFAIRGLRFQALHVSQESLETAHAAEPSAANDDSDHSNDADDADWDSDNHEDGHFVHFLHGLARWRYPALFALTVAAVGGTNATSLIYAGLAPVIWLPFALARREVSVRDALAFAARTTVLTAGVCAWWVSGLADQAGYGLDVLAYSETVKTVASDSQASEVLRGLGNWFFYGRDGISAWIQPSLSYTENLWLITVSFALPILSLAAAACMRWVHRGYFVTLVIVGTALSVGVYPYDNPSPAGSVFKAFAEGSTAGLALRSTPRAVPLVALGFGVLLAGGLEALFRLPWRRRVTVTSARRVHRSGGWARWVPAGAFVAVLVLIGLNMVPLWRGQFVDPNLKRKEALPSYVTQAADSLSNAARINGSETRVLELPGADFSDYRWGATLDPPLPGLMDRPYVSRELIPAGTPASAALVRAIDRRLQEGVYEPASLPSLARLMGVGDVVLRSDLQYERFRTPQPISTWAQWNRLRPEGLSAPKVFGPLVAETPAIPFIDEISLANPANAAEPPAMADFSVTDPSPIVRAERSTEPLLIAGDSEGMVDASASGMLDTTGVLRFAASQTSEKASATPVPTNADLLLTDSNRKRAERWGTVRENYGYVETATGKPLEKDPNDARLPVFPNETPDDQTVAVLSGVADIEASNYGNNVSYSPSDRPFYAFDGDLGTAWRVGAFGDPHGERLKVSLLKPVTTDHLTLVQPYNQAVSRWITKAQLTFTGPGGTSSVDVDLGDSSRSHNGQVVHFPSRQITSVEFKIVQTSNGTLPSYDGQSGVGLAELSIPGVKASELLRLPNDLFTAAGTDGSKQALSVMLTRDRANPQEPFKTDTELSMAREFTLPTERTFGVGGTARISANATDTALDALLGRTANATAEPTNSSEALAQTAVVTATSSNALPGSLNARATSAVDNNSKTAWTNAFGGNIGSWLQISSKTPVTLGTLNLKVIADGKHSVPTKLQLIVDGKPARTLTLPAVQDGKATDNVVSAPVSFAPVTGKTFRLVVTGERREDTEDYFNHGPLELPVAIAELGAADLHVAQPDASLPSDCRTDLLTIDGKPVGLQIGGSSTAAVARDGLEVRLCGNPVKLAAGKHVLRTARGNNTGIDLDRLILSSAADQKAGDPNSPFPGDVRTAATPRVTVTGEGAVAYRLSVTGASPGKPFWLVLGQSLSAGWHAKIVGTGSLAAPQLVDGYANGWLIDPKSANFDIELDWTPQDHVWIGVGVSAVALLICLLMILRRGPVRLARSEELDLVPGNEAMPYLVSPFGRDKLPLSKPKAIIATVVAAGFAFAFITPLAGLIVLAATLVALLVPRGRLLLRAGAAGTLVASVAYILQVQVRYDLPETGQWVQAFHKVATLSWLAPALLLADVLVGWARREDKLEVLPAELEPTDPAPAEAVAVPAETEPAEAEPTPVVLEKPAKRAVDPPPVDLEKS
jgi:arabinofuranan 3-O-arabinosyltransferase